MQTRLRASDLAREPRTASGAYKRRRVSRPLTVPDVSACRLWRRPAVRPRSATQTRSRASALREHQARSGRERPVTADDAATARLPRRAGAAAPHARRCYFACWLNGRSREIREPPLLAELRPSSLSVNRLIHRGAQNNLIRRTNRKTGDSPQEPKGLLPNRHRSGRRGRLLWRRRIVKLNDQPLVSALLHHHSDS